MTTEDNTRASVKICLFAGTTEGRRLAEFLDQQQADLTVCVATDYGGEMISGSDRIRLIEKRLSDSEIADLLAKEQFDMVIDATHPYAVRVTELLKEACEKTGTKYRRVLRENSHIEGDVVTVQDTEEAVRFLNTTEGNILLTTGSKELSRFTGIRGFADRVFARILPMQSSLEACTTAGLKASHIIAMQGPFSEEMNLAMLRSVHAGWMVTKDSGETGGFADKISAARKTGTGLVVIGRPPQGVGLPEAEMIRLLCSRFGFRQAQHVNILGIGPGSRGLMTVTAQNLIASADCIIGAHRMLGSADLSGKCTLETSDPQQITQFIRFHPNLRQFAILMSGDSGFFSGTRRLLPFLSDFEVNVHPGISSLSYFCSKLRISYEDIHVVSLHGRQHDIVSDVKRYKQVFVLAGGSNSVDNICRRLSECGMGSLLVTAGERLGYPDEQITHGTAKEFAEGSFDPLSVLLIENDRPDATVTHGLPDEVFLRDSGTKGVIPMTKSEIRSVCLSKLALTENALCWDIGSGTGSVSIEMALQARWGTVYAIDPDPEANMLTQRNAERLSAENIVIVQGNAPEVCHDLPTPTHVFIGGGSEAIRSMIEHLSTRNSDINVVATAVTLESVAELNQIIELPFIHEPEVVLVQTARSRKAGTHHLMTGGNPVYIFSMRIFGDSK